MVTLAPVDRCCVGERGHRFKTCPRCYIAIYCPVTSPQPERLGVLASPTNHWVASAFGVTALARRRGSAQTANARERVSRAMGRRLYVGNLPYKCTDEDLTELFSRAGAVDNVRVMRDQATGRARGFAFVEMVSDEDAQKAITEFHQYQMEGRALVVNEARPKPAGDFGGGGGGRGGGGYGGGGGGGGRREPRW